MSNLYILDHPLIQSKLTMLRNKETSDKEFRELVAEISSLICYEASRNLAVEETTVETPLGQAKGKILENKIGVVAILRTGIGMAEGILSLMPNAKLGHIGLYRDPNTLMPIEYFCKVPEDSEHCEIFLLDPMLATGGTASAAIQFIKERGIKKIKYLCLIAAPSGVKRVQEEHPDVDIYTAALDEYLTDNGYIFPGLGDVGSRLYGTK